MKKKLVILGGNPETGVLVDVANAMNIETVVIDPNPEAPAKNKAKESYDIDVFDIDTVVEKVIEIKADGVLVGVADILVKPYFFICKKLNFPCYATEKAVEAFCSKDGFKKYCAEYGIQDIPGIYLTKEDEIIKPNGVDFPLMVKPVDNGGGVGMKICRDEDDYISSVKLAFSHSKKGVVLVEKYMDCDDMAAYYTFHNGEYMVSAISDRYTTKIQGDSSPVCIGASYPSVHSELFLKSMHPKLCKLFKGLNLKDGILNIQFFVEDNQIYAYDPGFRLQGEAPHLHVLNYNGFDHRKMLVNFALTGSYKVENLHKRNNFYFAGNKAITVWVLLKAGKIADIIGIDSIKNDSDIHFVLERFQIGDVVKEEWLGTERQVYSRIYIAGKTNMNLNQKLDFVKANLSILDEFGDEMILEWMQPV